MEEKCKKMSPKKIKLFINATCSKKPKKDQNPNKTDVYHIDNVCRTDIIDIKDYGPENKKN